MKFIKYYKYYLTEGKMEDVAEQYSTTLDKNDIERCKYISQNSSVYFSWLLKIYTKDKDKYKENIAGINILLDLLDDYFLKYLRIKDKLPIERRDILKVTSFKQLMNIVDKYNDYDEIKNDTGVELLVANEKWLVFIPKTFAASKKWGWSRFCTCNDESAFDVYNTKNKGLVYFIHKFKYKLHHIMQLLPRNNCQFWDFEDSNSQTSLNEAYIFLGEYLQDGYLDVTKILDNVPVLSHKDYVDYYVYLITKMVDHKTIDEEDYKNILMTQNLINKEQLYEYVSNLSFNNLNELRNNILEYYVA